MNDNKLCKKNLLFHVKHSLIILLIVILSFFAGWFWKEALLLFKEYIIINAESHDIKDIITVII